MDDKAAKKVQTLCLAVDSDRVLLGMKKRGFGVGRWNGFGGKLSPGETVEQAARREMLEESGVSIGTMAKIGQIEFEWQDNPEIHEVHLFRVHSFEGVPIETDEMRPQWFNFNEVPFHSMWADDLIWFPLFLESRTFKAYFLFGSGDRILDYILTETDTF